MPQRCPFRLLALLALLSHTAASAQQPAYLVANLVASPDADVSSNAGQFQTCAGLTYFAADTAHSATEYGTESAGRTLWRTDGTQDGTLPLKEISTERRSAARGSVSEVGGACLFFVETPHGYELWKTDGTVESTTQLSGPLHVQNDVGAKHGGSVYFTADNCTLWRSDGTTAGTGVVADICPAVVRSPLTSHGGSLYFIAEDIFGRGLWSSNGTQAGTRLVKTFSRPNDDFFGGAPQFISAGATLFFTVRLDDFYDEARLWSTDGTSDGTVDLGIMEGPYVVVGDRLVYLASEYETGVEPWISDGTLAGTRMIKEISPGPGTSFAWDNGYFDYLTAWNDRVFFVANDGEHGYQPWVTDGTSEGTLALGDLRLDYDSLEIGNAFFMGLEDSVVLIANGTLWRTDGTVEGTELLYGAPGGFYIGGHAVLGDIGIVALNDKLWRTDGTAAGIVAFKDAPAGPQRWRPSQFIAAGDNIIFIANDGAGREPWRTDGTAGGTFRLADISPSDAGSEPDLLTDLNGSLVFSAGAEDDRRLWISDGTAAGTRLIRMPGRPQGFLYPTDLTRVGHSLIFEAADTEEDRALFVTNGTDGGTRRFDAFTSIRAAVPFGDGVLLGGYGPQGSGLWRIDSSLPEPILLAGGYIEPQSLAIVGEDAVIIARTPDPAVLRTDGTPEGTEFLRSFLPFGATIQPGMVTAGNRAYFVIHNCTTLQLWASDATEPGTRLVADLNPGAQCDFGGRPSGDVAVLGGHLFVVGGVEDHPEELFRLDGNSLQPVIGTEARQIYGIRDLTRSGDLLFFRANIPSGVRPRLWRTDGTAAGTVQLNDVDTEPYFRFNRTSTLTAVDTVIAFGAEDEASGREVWTSDGTPECTHLLADVAPGRLSSDPQRLTRSGDLLYFTADDGTHGHELWAVPMSAVTACPEANPNPPSASGGGGGCTLGRETRGSSAFALLTTCWLLVLGATRKARVRRRL